MYSKKSKAMKKVVEELNQTLNGHFVVEILYKEQNISADGLGRTEATQYIADGKERIFGMQLFMNKDHDKLRTLIKDYEREHLVRINKCPKIFRTPITC